jgi:uncharacterized cupin superfamily protein
MTDTKRPDCIRHWSEIERPDKSHYKGEDELFSTGAPFGAHFDLTKLGIHHVRLLPGRRTSYPHAESAEQEFVFVIEGAPDVWLDGHVHRLKPGDGVGFPAGTGQAHSFLNNTDTEVRLLVVGERNKAGAKIIYPVNPEQKPLRADWWHDAPDRPLGPHDGLTDERRATRNLR